MKIIDGDNEASSLNLDDKKFNEIMARFDGLIDTKLAIKAYDMALKNSSSKKNSDFTDSSSNLADSISEFDDSSNLTADFGENNSANVGNSDSNSDAGEETECLKNAYPIHEMDLETLARILSGKITIEDLVYQENFKNSETFFNPNNYNPNNYNSTNYNPSDFKQNNLRQNSTLKENQKSENLKKAYFDDVFDFKGSTLFDFEDYLKNTRVPTLEDERKAKKTEKKS